MKAFVFVVACCAILTGCPDNSSSRSSSAVGARNFTVFVKQQLALTSDSTDPVEINGATFVDTDADNPSAYDDVLAY